MLIGLVLIFFFAFVCTSIFDTSKNIIEQETFLQLYFDVDNHASWLSSSSLHGAANDSQ